MDRLTAMQVFVRVVESGSFSAVARELGSTQSAISKQVASLESYLGVVLLSRTTRSVALTDEGRSYFENVRRIVLETQETENELRSRKGQVTGRLRLGAAAGFGRFVLFPIVRTYMAQHPQVEVDLQLTDSFVDVVAQGLDAVVRVGDLTDSSLLAQRIGTARRSVVASKALAARLNQEARLPIKPEDLAQHDCIVYTGLATPGIWAFDARAGVHARKTKDSQGAQIKVKGRFVTSSTELVREAVLASMGIGFTPDWFFTRELANGSVVRLLAQYSPHPLPIHVVYPQTRRSSAKLAAFTELAKAELSKTPQTL
jgi:DNA-binding transcriptional LysR family regulator